MKYPNNDLWSVRQIEFLYDALEGYEVSECQYYVDKQLETTIPGIATYKYKGVIYFKNDRTIILEQGKDFGLTTKEVLPVLKEKDISFKLIQNEKSLS